MPSVQGTVEEIRVTEDYAWVLVNDPSDGSTTKVMLWSYFVQDDTPYYRIPHGMWLGLARDSMLHGKTVDIYYSSSGSLAISVELLA